jgi:nucleoside-diphosphate kinase
MEKTLVIVKPDAVGRTLIGRIITRFEEKGLQLVAAKLIRLDKNTLKRQYAHLAQEPFFEEILAFMSKYPALVTVWSGLDAVSTARKICGITKAREAESGTIRGDWAMSIMCNLVHASDSVANAKKEISYYFNKDEMLQYEQFISPLLYSLRESEG